MLKALIFDIGGVVIKYSELFAFSSLTDLLNIDQTIFEETMATVRKPLSVGKITENRFWELFLLKIDRTADINQLKKLYRDSYRSYLVTNNLIDSQNIDLIRQLKSTGLLTACLANTVPYNFDVYKELNILDLFDVKIASYKVGFKKPSQEIFTIAVNELHVEPQEIIFIDDQVRHVQAAQELKMHAIIYEDNDTLKEKLRNLEVSIQ